MVPINQLKKIQFLADLPDDILEKIAPHARQAVFKSGTILIRQAQEQHLVYMLVAGSICLNSSSDTGQVLTLDEITPGRSFGVSALIGTFPATFTAMCTDTCDVIVLSADLMRQLFAADPTVGYAVMRRVSRLFKDRMNTHTRQFVHALSVHPAIHPV
jgi:CRP-like cAMP-binding protein